MDIKLLDVNSINFNSKEEVGLSIVTLAELTKGKTDHIRHELYKQFISVWKKRNYHIYIPLDSNALQMEFIKSMKENKIDEAYNVLDLMCEQMLKMVFVYFLQMVCLIMIFIVFINHKFVVENGQISYENEREREVVEFSNRVANMAFYIYENQDTLFKDCHKEWKKDCGNQCGNDLFDGFIKEYFKIIGKTPDQKICLCGPLKNIDSVFFEKNHDITLERLKEIYDSYVSYKINDKLTKKIFIPYLEKTINEPKMKFEFNHISDSFLIFNALTAAKMERSSIVIDSNDKGLKCVYSLIK